MHKMLIYKFDKRCKTGLRLVSETTWLFRDDDTMKREVKELRMMNLYPEKDYKIECVSMDT